MALDGHVLFLDPVAGVGHGPQFRGQETPRLLVGEPGRVVEAPHQFEAARLQARLLDQLTGGRNLGRLAFDITLAGRDLQELHAERGPELTDEHHLARLLVDWHHHHGTGVVDEVPFEGFAVRGFERPDGHVEQMAVESMAFADFSEATGRQHRPPPPLPQR